MNIQAEFGVSIIDFEKTNQKRKKAKQPYQRDKRRCEALPLLLARELEHVEDSELLDIEILTESLYRAAGFETFGVPVVMESITETMTVMGWSFHNRDEKVMASRGSSKTRGIGGVDVRCCDQQVTILIDNGDSYPHFQENYAFPALPKKLKRDDRGVEAKEFMIELFQSYYINITE